MTIVETKGRSGGEVRPRWSVEAGGALGGKALAELVLKAVRQVDEGELNPPLSGASIAYHPRVMLAMLTYCYAAGVFGSQDVEEMMYADADFRALCGMDYPDWKRLKRFRRHNHAPLRRALEETFRGAWSLTCSAEAAAEAAREVTAPPDWIAAEAQSRLEQAMFIDQMAMD